MDKADAKYLVLRTIGNFLLLFAIFGVIATFGPALFYEAKYQVIKARGVDFKIASQDSANQLTGGTQTTFGDLLTGSKEQEITPPDTEFSIVIPKIGASAKIFPNVDPSDENAFLPVLKKGVAHAQGSVFPGGRGNIFLFAHSTDNFWDAAQYNAVFYLLKDLKEGDLIVVFYQGKRHDYYVTKNTTVDPSDTSFIDHAATGTEQLILQTCWPPGTTLERLLVTARPRKTETIFK
jgi:sortase A